MSCRQSIPERWLILGGAIDEEQWTTMACQMRGSGILLLEKPSARDWRRLKVLARLHHLTIVLEAPGTASRVHNVNELKRALLQRCPLIFLSPINETKSHPDWRALPRMRAATLARLAGRRLLALGGMDDRRFSAISPLGFIGWGGITAWRQNASRPRINCAAARQCPG